MLEDILGQPYAVTVLENALRGGRLAGSYLFVGPPGVGKGTTAREFAKHLCGATANTDHAARAIDAGTYPDVRVIEPQGPSRIIRIGQLWPRDNDGVNAMLRDLHFEPISSQKRVFIIEGAEGLNESSGNSLLKTLEEPPPYAHFILTATSAATVLPTILSRCQVVRFGAIPAEEIEEALQTRFSVSPAQARFLAVYCEGKLGQAVTLARSPGLLAGRDEVLDLARELTTAAPIKALKLSEEFRKASSRLKVEADDEGTSDGEKEKATREPLLRGLDLIASFLRDVLAVRVMGPERAALINIDRESETRAAAARYTPEHLRDGLSLLAAMRRAIARNANGALAVDVLFTHLAITA